MPIFWESSYKYNISDSLILSWGNGYYKSDDQYFNGKAKMKASTTTASEQEVRKEMLRRLYLRSYNPDESFIKDVLIKHVPDTEWFFIGSMFYSSLKNDGIPSQTFYDSKPVWVAGAERLEGLSCNHARTGQSLGLQTMVWIPWGNGVVELGSTELISHNEALINKVKILFNFNNSLRMGATSDAYLSKDVSNISNILARGSKPFFKILALLRQSLRGQFSIQF